MSKTPLVVLIIIASLSIFALLFNNKELFTITTIELDDASIMSDPRIKQLHTNTLSESSSKPSGCEKQFLPAVFADALPHVSETQPSCTSSRPSNFGGGSKKEARKEKRAARKAARKAKRNK